jgi:hypothetical protein
MERVLALNQAELHHQKIHFTHTAGQQISSPAPRRYASAMKVGPIPVLELRFHYVGRSPLVPYHFPAPPLHLHYEPSLHHRAHQGRNEVHLFAVRPPRQHPRLRPQRREPAHPGRHRHQPPRHRSPPRARNVLLARHPTAHLALLALSPYNPGHSNRSTDLSC